MMTHLHIVGVACCLGWGEIRPGEEIRPTLALNVEIRPTLALNGEVDRAGEAVP
jgi:hypothetical protein